MVTLIGRGRVVVASRRSPSYHHRQLQHTVQFWQCFLLFVTLWCHRDVDSSVSARVVPSPPPRKSSIIPSTARTIIPEKPKSNTRRRRRRRRRPVSLVALSEGSSVKKKKKKKGPRRAPMVESTAGVPYRASQQKRRVRRRKRKVKKSPSQRPRELSVGASLAAKSITSNVVVTSSAQADAASSKASGKRKRKRRKRKRSSTAERIVDPSHGALPQVEATTTAASSVMISEDRTAITDSNAAKSASTPISVNVDTNKPKAEKQAKVCGQKTWTATERSVSQSIMPATLETLNAKKEQARVSSEEKTALAAETSVPQLSTTVAAAQKAKKRNSMSKESTSAPQPVNGTVPKAKKRATIISTATATKNPPRTLTAAQMDSLRRLKREWRDAVTAGIAFDWKRGEPVLQRKRKETAPSHVWLGPLDNNLWTWHFTVTGIPGSPYSNGVYHGRLVLPVDYPATPPRVSMWTPSGRFAPRVDICLSATNYHPETWRPAAWSIRTIIESLRLHMLTAANEIGGVNESYEKRLEHASNSRHWKCQIKTSRSIIRVDHERMLQYLPPLDSDDTAEDSSEPPVVDTGTPTVSKVAQTGKEQPFRHADAGTPKKRKKKKMKRRRRKRTTKVTQRDVHEAHPVHKPQHATRRVPILVHIVQQTLKSPVRLGLLAFLALFCILNRNG